jgi:hypothetical protein
MGGDMKKQNPELLMYAHVLHYAIDTIRTINGNDSIDRANKDYGIKSLCNITIDAAEKLIAELKLTKGKK